MNEYFLILKGNNKDLAIAEFETIYFTYFKDKIKLKKIENTFYKFDTNKNIDKKEFLQRLTYTNYIGVKINKNKDLSKYDGVPFVLRIKKSYMELKSNFEEKKLAKEIWVKMKNPKVSLEKSKVEFNYLIYSKNKILCRKIFENEKKYLNRMPKLRPVSMPFTLKSDMARIAINLLGIKKGIILDPFCGIGGVLLEGEDMKFSMIGNDLSWRDLEHVKTNFKYFFPKKKPNLLICDTKNQFLKKNSVDGIVTDIPYGKSSSKLGSELYENFLENSYKMLKKGKRVVVIYANFVTFRPLTKKYFKEIMHIDEYINKSMTRHVIVLEKK